MIFGEKDPVMDDVGKRRERMRFAWLPRFLSDGRIAWLERCVETWEVQRVLPLRPLPPTLIDSYWYPEWRRVRVFTLREQTRHQ